MTNTLFKFQVVRYSVEPEECPINRIVAFKMTNTQTGKGYYLETLIPFEETVNMEEKVILKMAFDRLSPKIERIKNSTNPIIGIEYVPSN
jgi:hypothetical protein